MSKGLVITKNIVRMLLGLLFIASAIMKLLSIDTFQTYVLSFDIIGFTLTEIAARLLIAAELVVGALLLLKIHYRLGWWAAALMTAGFTLFLGYVLLFRQDSNCHCFGDIIEVQPLHSVFKNVGILLLLAFSYRVGDKHLAFFKKEVGTEEEPRQKLTFGLTDAPFRRPYLRWSRIVIGVGAFVAAFVLFPPNAIYSKLFSKDNLVSTPVFDKAYADSSFYLRLNDIRYDAQNDTVTFTVDTTRLDIDQGNYLVAVVSAGCKYCKQSFELLNEIVGHHKVPTDRVKVLIWSGDYEQCARFMRITKCYQFEYHRIHPLLAIDMVYGSFPTFIKISNGKIVGSFNYRGISEGQVVDFLKKD